MNRLFFLTAFLLVCNIAFSQKEYSYPIASKDKIFDVYFKDSINDPYQWMENPADPRLLEWLDKEEMIKEKISNRQTRKTELLQQMSSIYTGVSSNRTKGYRERNDKSKAKYLFREKISNENKSLDLTYKEQGQLNYKVLIKASDYLTRKEDKLGYSSWLINEDKDLAFVTISINGSDWNTGYIFNLKNGKRFPYVIENLKGGRVAWKGSHLYYYAYNEPAKGRELLEKAEGQKLYRLDVEGTGEPELLYTNPDPSGVNPFYFSIYGNRLFLYHLLKIRGKSYSAISYVELNSNVFYPESFLVFPAEEKIQMRVRYTSNDSIWLYTNWDAPNGRLLMANINNPKDIVEFTPEYDMVLDQVRPLGKDKLALVYLKDGQNIALIQSLKGELLKRITFPVGKKLNGFYEWRDLAFTNFTVSSFFHPDILYQIDLDQLDFEPVEILRLPYDYSILETRYVTYPSKDGTEVGMYITCRKGVKLNGKNPVMLYGYGGYGNVVEPFYEGSNTLFLAHGGIIAIPNVRGGGAKGGDWAKKGRRLNKQNAIDDFIGAAEYLIEEKYTNSQKILASGGSHGALLVTSAMVQRPELFKAVVAEAGPYDMLRFNKYTAGAVNTNILEFGTPEDQEDYQNLRSYSPLHNLKENEKYPSLLLITGNSDDRVPPFHSYKFTASIQEKADSKGLYVLYVTKGTGHGQALTVSDFREELLFKYYFIFDTLGIAFYNN